MGHALAVDIVPPYVPFDGVREEDTDTVQASPERRVGDENDWLWYEVWQRNSDRIELLAHPDVRTFAALGKLFERLFAADVRMPQTFLQPLWALF